MDYETIILEKKDNIATLTFNRPDRLNAMTGEMWDEVNAAIADVNADDEMRVLVVTGAGRGFCAGADVARTATDLSQREAAPSARGGDEGLRRLIRGPGAIVLGLQKMEKPTIAMVNGVAAGNGTDIALACDMRVGSENTRFVNAFVRRGLVPGDGGAWFYSRVMGLGKALEYCFTGDPIEAKEAERVGILNYLVPAAELEKATMALARKIADGPPIAIRLAKRLLYHGLGTDLETHEHLAAAYQGIAGSSEDAREGNRALAEKRPPKYQGR
ncbi:MAG: enoyl-CoA hydratase/isomerase family protein [Chloroflexi bacterium]|nr:enoyl-CoA hydratase/isomerase family protein [Chloroflexota bacterium]MBI3040849.1 enoyl-CoA hydratase/isomerase family protein [Chloroflexota bacterium]MBI3931300.1 enoyl-CoA hydratase/isomerase family protein [Chloroflexota bacterium]